MADIAELGVRYRAEGHEAVKAANRDVARTGKDAERAVDSLAETQRQASTQAKEFATANRNAATTMRGQIDATTGVANANRQASESTRAWVGELNRQAQGFNQLRASVDPAFAATRKYEAAVEQANAAVRSGVVSQREAANVLAMMRAQYAQTGQAAMAMGGSMRAANAHTTNLMFQFQDIGMMLAAGQNPLMLAMQQGTQVSGVFRQMQMSGQSAFKGIAAGLAAMVNPMSIATLGVIAGGAALTQWAVGAFRAEDAGDDLNQGYADSAKGAKTFGDAVDIASQSLVSSGRIIDDLANGSIDSLVQKYGRASDALRGIETRRGQAGLRESALTVGAVLERVTTDDILGSLPDSLDFRIQALIEATPEEIADFESDVSAMMSSVDARLAVGVSVDPGELKILSEMQEELAFLQGDNSEIGVGISVDSSEITRAQELLKSLPETLAQDDLSMPQLKAISANISEIITVMEGMGAAVDRGAITSLNDALSLTEALIGQTEKLASTSDDYTNALRDQLEASRERSREASENRVKAMVDARDMLESLQEQADKQEAINEYLREGFDATEARKLAERDVYFAMVETLDVTRDMKDQLKAAYTTANDIARTELQGYMREVASEASDFASSMAKALGFGHALGGLNLGTIFGDLTGTAERIQDRMLMLNGADQPLSRFDRGGMSSDALQAITRLEQIAGRTFQINSAHRSETENQAAGGAKQSQHIQGNAFDINVSDLSREERMQLIRQARQGAGFGGVGVYDNSLHFDTGETRAWGSDFTSGSIPAWAQDAVQTPRRGDAEAARAAAEATREKAQADREAAREAAGVTRANEGTQRAYDQLMASLDPAVAISQQFAQAQQVVADALAAGQITAEEAAQAYALLRVEQEQALDALGQIPDELNPERWETIKQGIDSLSESLVRAAANGESIGDVLRNFLFDAAIKAAAAQLSSAIQNIFKGMGAGGGGFLDSFLNFLFPSGEGGGRTRSGARSGGMDGKGGYMMMVHPDETIVDNLAPQKGMRALADDGYFDSAKPTSAQAGNPDAYGDFARLMSPAPTQSTPAPVVTVQAPQPQPAPNVMVSIDGLEDRFERWALSPRGRTVYEKINARNGG